MQNHDTVYIFPGENIMANSIDIYKYSDRELFIEKEYSKSLFISMKEMENKGFDVAEYNISCKIAIDKTENKYFVFIYYPKILSSNQRGGKGIIQIYVTPQGCLKQFSDDFPFRRPRSDRSFHVVNKIACKSSDFNVVFTIPYFCWLPPAPSTVQPIPFFPFFANLGGTKPLLKMYVSTAYPPSSSCVSATCST